MNCWPFKDGIGPAYDFSGSFPNAATTLQLRNVIYDFFLS